MSVRIGKILKNTMQSSVGKINKKVAPNLAQFSNYIFPKSLGTLGQSQVIKRPMGLFDINNIPVFASKTITDFSGLEPKKILLTHLTDYLPENGRILTSYEKMGTTRNTLHFALNHAVLNPLGGGGGANGWTKKQYAVLVPFDRVFSSSRANNLIGGKPNDFMINGGLDLPTGSYILKHNPDIPVGKVLFSDASAKISEMKNVKGVTLVETSGNVYDAVDDLVDSLGYSNFKDMHAKAVKSDRKMMNIVNEPLKLQELLDEVDGDFDKMFEKLGIDNIEQFVSEKNIEENEKYLKSANKAWQEFCERSNFINSAHSCTVFSQIEDLVDTVAVLSKYSNKWEYDGNNLKEVIQSAIETAKKHIVPNKKIVIDLDVLSDIINQSDTPAEARKLIQTKLKVKDNLTDDKTLTEQVLKAIIDHYLETCLEYSDEFADSWIF